ncbi:MAG: AraC family transcriptional regulator [Pseudomonadota bacterium]
MTGSLEQLLVIGAVQGVLLFLLLVFDHRLGLASRFLGGLCLIAAVALFSAFLKPYPAHWGFSALGGLFYVPALGGAFAYLYCRSALSGARLSASDALLFVPFLVCLLMSADLVLRDPRGTAAWVAGGHYATWRLQASEYVLFLQAFGFSVATSAMIWRYRRSAGQLLSSYSPAKFDLLLALQLFTIAIWVLNALPSLSSAPVVFVHAANCVTVLVLYFIAIAQWRQPQLFLVEHLDSEAAEYSAEVSDEPTPGQAPQKQSDDDLQALESLFSHIRLQVEENDLFRRSQLTLSELSEEVGLTRHQVSEAINAGAGQNFYEFINSYRIDAVRRALDAGYEGRLLVLAFESGFSSKSTFNAAFKKSVGVPPGDYRRSLTPAQ